MKTSRSGERLPEDMRQVERIRSRLAMVFQSFNLWSHMTIMQNITEVPIQVLKVPVPRPSPRREHPAQPGGAVGASRLLSRSSGGQQQRAAIARRWRWSPEVMLLFDEPSFRPRPLNWWGGPWPDARAGGRGRTMMAGDPRDVLRRDVNKVMFLHQGAVEEEGNPRRSSPIPQVGRRFKQFISSSIDGRDSIQPSVLSSTIDVFIKREIHGTS